MKRWNGWGDPGKHYHLAPEAGAFLAQLVGPGEPTPDVTLADVAARVPPSRLPAHPLVTTDALERVRHARGQSLPDWVALRSGGVGAFPDGVAYPTSDDQVRALITFAQAHGLVLIPYGGGSSVVGHINPPSGGPPVLTVDMGRLNRLAALDEVSHLATFEAGVIGPELENQLKMRGFTLGHFPQSFEHSTLGGWIASRSSGQQSFYFGRIEDHFAGGHVETPVGTLVLPPHPASAAGPDLRQLVLGSEGRLGIITRATVRVRPIPADESFHAHFFHSWSDGVRAVRAIVQAGVGVSMLRLSDPVETDTNLQLAGRNTLVRIAQGGLSTIGYGDTRCLLIIGVTGDKESTALAYRQVRQISREFGGLSVGEAIGRLWRKNRFFTPYLRNTLWELGYAVDTFETAVPWSAVEPATAAMTTAVRDALQDEGEQVHAFAHLSHIYRDGASVYVTYVFRRAADPDVTLARWQRLKAAGSAAVVAHGGTISHQHGVGVDHAAYLADEKGPVGMTLLQAVVAAGDPAGVMNPGKLLVEEPLAAAARA